MAETPAISFENVSFSYGSRRVIDDVRLRVQPGELVALVGQNGSGKSTLLRLACGLLQPDAGDVSVCGCSTTANRGFDARRQCGIVFQNPENQLVASVVENEVAFGPENLGLPREDIRERVARALSAVGLKGFEQRQTHSLSGGQKQRLALAGALAMQPKVLLLDEASSMLDPQAREEFMQNIRQLNQAGMTIAMATHHPEEAAQATRIIEMRNGKIVDDRPIFDVEARVEQEQRELHPQPSCFGKSPFTPSPFGDDEKIRVASRDPAHVGLPPIEDEASSLPVLDFQNVSYDYEDDGESRTALIDVCATVEEGEFLAVVGPTGSGKSTLIQHMNGLLHPTSGEVLLRGKSTDTKAVTNRARRTVGLVLQYPENQLFAPTVYEDVAFGPKNLGLDPDDIDDRVREALEHVGLSFEEFANRNPFHLSGGQQRRVAIAGVLAMRPDVLALDEPCAGLDPDAHAAMVRLLKDLHAAGQTVVMVTHDMSDMEALSTRILHMQAGRAYDTQGS